MKGSGAMYSDETVAGRFHCFGLSISDSRALFFNTGYLYGVEAVSILYV